jgi:hypothetical protein
MSRPLSQEVYSFLEGYNIDGTILSTEWIEKRRDNFIIPFVERVCRTKLNTTKTVTEYISGTGKDTILLNTRCASSLVSISYVSNYDEYGLNIGSVTFNSSEGIIKLSDSFIESGRVFKKGIDNIKVVYTIGSETINEELIEAVIYLLAEQSLGLIGARTGGGPLSVQGYTKNYGSRGMFQDIRNDLKRQATAILNKYRTGVIGG